jgi:hypothetical protein
VSTVATCTKATSALSADSQARMLDVYASGITSAWHSPVPATPDAASALLAVMAAGPGMGQAAGSAPATPARRLLAETNSTITSSIAGGDNSTPAWSPSYEPAWQVASLLLESATPATSYKSGGDSGLYVGVSNLLGKGYVTAAPALALGPTLLAGDSSQADAAAAANAAVAFSGALAGDCTDADDQPLVNSSACLVPVAAVYVPDATRGLNGNLPAGYSAASGAVAFTVNGQAHAALPCASASCTATIKLPLSSSGSSGASYTCVRVSAAGLVLPSDAAVASSSPRGSCVVSSAGVYLLVAAPAASGSNSTSDGNSTSGGQQEDALPIYTNITGLVRSACVCWVCWRGCAHKTADRLPASQLPTCTHARTHERTHHRPLPCSTTPHTPTTQTLGAPVVAAFEFGMPAHFVFADFVASASAVESFKTGVISQLAANLQIDASSITVTGITQGSIIAMTEIITSTLNAAQ